MSIWALHMAAKTGLQYTVDHVGTTALLLSKNGLRIDLRAPNFLQEHALHTPSFALYMHIIHPCNPPFS